MTSPHSPYVTVPWESPAAIGLPDKFSAWTTGQRKAFESVIKALTGPKRFVAVAAPTGYGKSVVYMAAIEVMKQRALAYMPRFRAAVITASRGLQDQNVTNFGTPHWHGVDVRGQANYSCRDYANLRCDVGKQVCRAGMFCTYQQAYRRASDSDLPMTNYAYWLAVAKMSMVGLGERKNLKQVKDAKPFDLAVFDEAHDAERFLADSMHIDIKPDELIGNGGLLQYNKWPPGLEPNLALTDHGDWTNDEWSEWASTLSGIVTLKIEAMDDTITRAKEANTYSHLPQAFITRYFKLNSLLADLEVISDNDEDRVIEVEERLGANGKYMVITSDVITPAKSSERYLFRKIPKVLLTSATIVPANLSGLGVRDEEVEFLDLPNVFDLRRAPVWWCVGTRMNYRTPDPELRTWLAKIDAIIDGYPNSKGIVHTSSYKLQKYIVEHSRHHDRIIHNVKAMETTILAERFKVAEGNQVFVSPSITTGYDFVGDQCRFAIIAKLPLQQVTSKITRARLSRNPGYVDSQVAQEIVQSAGRGMRGPTDWCATYIVDNNISWFFNRNRRFFPAWFALAPMGDRVPVLTPIAFGA
jgi:Rad3-related DNA helicase